MITFALDFSEIERAVDESEALLEREIPRALEEGALRVAIRATEHHEYHDRTGKLTRSITAEPVTGSWSGGSLKTAVSATTPYADAIEEGSPAHIISARRKPWLRFKGRNGWVTAKSVNHPGNRAYQYLGQALDAKQDEITNLVEKAMDAALEKAGL